MNVKKLNQNIYQIDLSKERGTAIGPFLTWILQIAMNKPELILKIIQAVVSVAKWALNNFRDKDGMPRTPFWVKALGWIGIKPMQELREVCDEACKAVEGLPEMPPKGL
jgi:hypothetical protein